MQTIRDIPIRDFYGRPISTFAYISDTLAQINAQSYGEPISYDTASWTYAMVQRITQAEGTIELAPQDWNRIQQTVVRLTLTSPRPLTAVDLDYAFKRMEKEEDEEHTHEDGDTHAHNSAEEPKPQTLH